MVALLLALLLLILINAFFAFSEFAIVRVRSSWVEELEWRKHPRAAAIRHLRDHVDDYLSVVQVGITLTSIGLGFVGEPAMAGLLTPLFSGAGAQLDGLARGAAIATGYLLVSFLHIVLGELVPKGLAVRSAERAALWAAWPMRLLYVLFHVPRIVLRKSADLVLRFLGTRAPARDTVSDDELRILLGSSQSRGLMSVRRLLMVENVFDLGGLAARDAMRPRDRVAHLPASATLDDFIALFRKHRFSRYPAVDDAGRVAGTIHVKDVLEGLLAEPRPASIASMVRRCHQVREDAPLESVMADLQRRREQMIEVVRADGAWIGIVTMEDILEEIVGMLGDEFEAPRPMLLADWVKPEQVVTGLAAGTLMQGITETLARAVLPGIAVAEVESMLHHREEEMSTYVGHGIAIPHARLAGLARTVVLIGQSPKGMVVSHVQERAHLLFILLTPAGSAGEHVVVLSRIAALAESQYVIDRIRAAETPAQVLALLRESEPAVSPE